MLAMASSLVQGDDLDLFPLEGQQSSGEMAIGSVVSSPLCRRDCEQGECCGDSGDLVRAEEVGSQLGFEEGESTSSNSDGQDSVNNSVPGLVDSLETEWTDEKHSSYLDSMEATFVKKLYDREYCSLDLCGQTPKEMEVLDPDSAESRLDFPSPFNEFKVWQKGCWRTPPNFGVCQRFSLPILVGSSWVQHFRAAVSFNKQAVPESTVNESRRIGAEKGVGMLKHPCPTSAVIDKAPNVSQGLHIWHHRLQRNYSGSASHYSGSASLVNKRKLTTACDGKSISAKATDLNFKDETKTEGNQPNTSPDADQNFEGIVNRQKWPKKPKVNVGGCNECLNFV